MKRLIIGVSNYMPEDFSLLAESLDEQFNRHLQPLEQVELTDVGAAIITSADIQAGLHKMISETGYGIPVFLVTDENPVSAEDYVWLTGVIDLERQSIEYYCRQINEAVTKYECRLLPPFFKQLTHYVEMGNSAFDCPGHQGGQFFKKHPAGKQFYDFFGENLFRSDLCNADVDLGDLLIHEGSAHQAQAHAAKVFNADKTYFVLNGTSASNKWCVTR